MGGQWKAKQDKRQFMSVGPGLNRLFPVEQVVTEPGTVGAVAIKRSKLEPGVLARVRLRCDFGSHSNPHPTSPTWPSPRSVALSLHSSEGLLLSPGTYQPGFCCLIILLACGLSILYPPCSSALLDTYSLTLIHSLIVIFNCWC